MFWLNFDRDISVAAYQPLSRPLVQLLIPTLTMLDDGLRTGTLYLAFPKKDWSFRSEGQGLPVCTSDPTRDLQKSESRRQTSGH